MLKAVIVDDQQLAIRMLKVRLSQNGQVDVVGEFTEPAIAMDEIGILKPDVVFLDMEMPEVNGMILAKRLLEQHTDLQIVFVTAFSKYAVDAFAVEAVDYLLKPATQELVDRAVSRLLKRKGILPNSELTGKGGRVFCLGSFEVYGTADNSSVKWRTAKVEELFAYLLHNRNTAVSKSRILDALWPENDPEQLGASLHTAIYRVKRHLKEAGVNAAITFHNSSYRLELGSDVYCDFIEFEDSSSQKLVITAENVEKLEKRVALYQGDYYEQKDYGWCTADRTRLSMYFIDVTWNMAQYYMGIKQYQKGIHILNKLFVHSFFHEDAHEMMLRLYFTIGDRLAAMNHYRTVENTFREEMGIEPRSSLKQLYENIMNAF